MVDVDNAVDGCLCGLAAALSGMDGGERVICFGCFHLQATVPFNAIGIGPMRIMETTLFGGIILRLHKKSIRTRVSPSAAGHLFIGFETVIQSPKVISMMHTTGRKRSVYGSLKRGRHTVTTS